MKTLIFRGWKPVAGATERPKLEPGERDRAAQAPWRPGAQIPGQPEDRGVEIFMQTEHQHDVDRACFAVKVRGFNVPRIEVIE